VTPCTLRSLPGDFLFVPFQDRKPYLLIEITEGVTDCNIALMTSFESNVNTESLIV
jgi:hypothetical protein